MAHTNGIESHWAMLKRGYHGGYHQMSAKSTCIAMSRRHGHWTRRIRWSLWLLELSASVCGTRNSPADLKVERIAQVIPLKCDAVPILSRGYSFHGGKLPIASVSQAVPSSHDVTVSSSASIARPFRAFSSASLPNSTVAVASVRFWLGPTSSTMTVASAFIPRERGVPPERGASANSTSIPSSSNFWITVRLLTPNPAERGVAVGLGIAVG